MDNVTTMLTNQTFLSNIPLIILLLIVIAIFVKLGIVRVKTNHLTLGKEPIQAYKERLVIKNQIDFARTYCYALEPFFLDKQEEEEGEKENLYLKKEYSTNLYFTKYIIELIFDRVVTWITCNHLNDTDDYISCKQDEIVNLLRSKLVKEELLGEEYKEKYKLWTKDLIQKLITIRKVTK